MTTTTEEFLAGLSDEDLVRVARSIKLRDDEHLTPELLDDIITPEHIGPTWAKNPDGSWLLPDKTLGWELAGWCSKWLLDPRDGITPWKFTPEQLRFVLWWYAVDDDGHFIYQTGVLQRRKGW